jgi:predicted nucleic acid-binding protein
LSEVICNTSPLQYLHQLDRLELLHLLAGRVVVPPAVIDELAVGKANGVAVPEPLTLDWITVHRCSGFFYTSPSDNNLFIRINDVSLFL